MDTGIVGNVGQYVVYVARKVGLKFGHAFDQQLTTQSSLVGAVPHRGWKFFAGSGLVLLQYSWRNVRTFGVRYVGDTSLRDWKKFCC